MGEHPGTGEDEKSDKESNSRVGDDSYFTNEGNITFFDPPIENYKNLYGANRVSSSRLFPDTGQPSNTFLRMRSLKFRSKLSGLGGTGNFTDNNTTTDNNTDNNGRDEDVRGNNPIDCFTICTQDGRASELVSESNSPIFVRRKKENLSMLNEVKSDKFIHSEEEG